VSSGATPNFEKNHVNQILPLKNWLAEARQFQISMSERTDGTEKVGFSQHGRPIKKFDAHFN